MAQSEVIRAISQSEVVRAIVLEDSPCGGGPAPVAEDVGEQQDDVLPLVLHAGVLEPEALLELVADSRNIVYRDDRVESGGC